VSILALQAVAFATAKNRFDLEARGYAAPAKRDSPLARTVRRLSPGAQVFSNDPWALSYSADRQPVQLAPVDLVPGLSHRPARAGDLADAARCAPGGFVAWFGARSEPKPRFRGPGADTFELRPVTRVRDGNLYRVALRDHAGEEARSGCPRGT
jgi:hypothetical protein